MHSELWKWDATALAEAIRKREISCVEAVTSCSRRMDEVNPQINAVVEDLSEQALLEAELADQMILRGEAVGPLHGVPITTKINVDQKGSATSNGVLAYRELLAEVDSPSVVNLKRSGAVIFGRTNTPCFSWRWFTDNALHGRTFNPWDPARTPGGSSGGAAAAVACGIGPVAHSNDQGGSIRYPAYACGVYGLRPTIGRAPAYNATASAERALIAQLTSTQGPTTRSVRDLALMMNVLSSADHRDPWWVPVPPLEPPRPSPCKVALFMNLPDTKISSDVADALRTAAAWLSEAGYKVEEAEPPHFAETARLWRDLLITEAEEGMLTWIEQLGDDPIRRATNAIKSNSSRLDLSAYVRAQARRSTILREWCVFFQTYELLLLPISSEQPFEVDADQAGGEVMLRLLNAQSPLLATAVLGLPGLAAPVGISSGLPTGVQLVAGRFQEDLLLGAARALEMSAPTITPIDPRVLGAQRRP